MISDTHGTLNPIVGNAFQGVDHIIHAGDVGNPEVLKALQVLAPTSAVRGNMDAGAWSKSLPPSDVIELAGVMIYLVHDLYTMDIDPLTAGVKVVISGHTHQPEIRSQNGVLYFNPGSASYGRYGNPPSIGQIELSNGRIVPKIIQLNS
ncbi:MAG: metallophosphoesterase family protein [Desulfobacteraceae bacterium]